MNRDIVRLPGCPPLTRGDPTRSYPYPIRAVFPGLFRHDVVYVGRFSPVHGFTDVACFAAPGFLERPEASAVRVSETHRHMAPAGYRALWFKDAWNTWSRADVRILVNPGCWKRRKR